MAWTVYRSDTPTGSNGTSIDTRAWGNEGGGSGGQWSIVAGAVDIQGNEFHEKDGAGSLAVDAGSGASLADQRVSATMQAEWFVFVYGYQDSSNFYEVLGVTALSTHYQIYEVVAGVPALLATSSATFSVGDVVRATMDVAGSTMSLDINGSNDVSPFSESTFTSGGWGLRLAINGKASDFLVEQLAGGGGTAVPVFYHHRQTQGIS